MVTDRVDVAIIGAMAEEIEAITVFLEDCKTYQQINSVYYRGIIQDKSVVVFQSGIGKVNAAVATTFVIEHFSPSYIINIGSAGGICNSLDVGNVVVSDRVIYHDVDVTLVGCEYGQVPNMPLYFCADKGLVKLTQESVRRCVELKVVTGLIGCGDYFVSDSQAIATIRQRFPDIVAADMESAAIAHACYLYNTPFVIIRAISDVVDKPENKVDFFSFLSTAAKHSACIVVGMIKNS